MIPLLILSVFFSSPVFAMMRYSSHSGISTVKLSSIDRITSHSLALKQASQMRSFPTLRSYAKMADNDLKNIKGQLQIPSCPTHFATVLAAADKDSQDVEKLLILSKQITEKYRDEVKESTEISRALRITKKCLSLLTLTGIGALVAATVLYAPVYALDTAIIHYVKPYNLDFWYDNHSCLQFSTIPLRCIHTIGTYAGGAATLTGASLYVPAALADKIYKLFNTSGLLAQQKFNRSEQNYKLLQSLLDEIKKRESITLEDGTIITKPGTANTQESPSSTEKLNPASTNITSSTSDSSSTLL